MADKVGGEEIAEEISTTYTLDHFAEVEEVITIIESVGTICHDSILMESAAERFTVILDKYQEQPHLLDPHLENLIQRLQRIVRDPTNPPKVVHQAFKYFYLITKVRGAKYIVRLFSHEVADLEPILAMLTQQNAQDHDTWETRYILLLWLSIICLVPFDMARFDGFNESNRDSVSVERQKPVVDRIIDMAKLYLSVPDKSRDAAASVLAKFVSRPDVKKLKLADFLDWCLVVMVKSDGENIYGMMQLTGILTTLALLFKHGKRDDLLVHAPIVMKQVCSGRIAETNNTLLRKLNIKLIQRIGLTFLKPRLASWRYQRGSRSLMHNLVNPFSSTAQDQKKTADASDTNEDEEYDVPEEIEDVIEQLLSGLKDKDTVVRWSAAKGVGRITGRLPKELADEVVGTVLELFSTRESDSAWHGGCLALAELGRRGLLLPQRLPEVVPVVLKALAYDERRGSYSVGSHVRDAACYVCWAFARAYDPKDVSLYVKEIASALLICVVFDREVNCRRAASAAFQENVGRQGTFPHGIDILTTADYYAVGNRTNTYLNISVYIAQFEEYTLPLIDNLVDVRLQHWDSAIRELAGKALHALTPKAPEYLVKKVLPKLLSRTSSIDLYSRHGNICACGDIIHAVHLWAKQQGRNAAEVVDSFSLEALKNIVPRLAEAKLFRGLGGEFMRQAVSYLIEKLSISELPWHGDDVIDHWQRIIDDNLSHTEPQVQEAAVSALRALCAQYYKESSGLAIQDVKDKIITEYIQQLKSTNQFSRLGVAQALGAMPSFMIAGRLKEVVEALITASKVEPNIFAEARREAMRALGCVACSVGLNRDADDNTAVNESLLDHLYQAFLEAMEDYTVDNRGDVGAWVREASMSGMENITSLAVKVDPTLLSPETCKKIICSVVQQASEKIDRTRSHAGDIFLRMLYSDRGGTLLYCLLWLYKTVLASPPIPNIPHHKDLLEIFPRSECATLNWSAPSDCFPLVTKLLRLQSYRYPVLLGLTVSVGGLTESLVRHSGASLLSYLSDISQSKEDVHQFADTLVAIYEDNKKNDRVILPLFKMLDLLLSNGCFDVFTEEPDHWFPLKLFNLTKGEITRIGDARKLIASINVCFLLHFNKHSSSCFCDLLQFEGNTRRKSLQQLMMFLCHKFPRVRKTAADQLYTTVMTFDDVIAEDNVEEVLSILSETPWDDVIENVRPKRNTLCDLCGIPKPVLKVQEKTPSGQKKEDELASYKDLVSRHGY